MTPRPNIEVGDRIKKRGDPKVYEVAKIDENGIMIWTQRTHVAKGMRFQPDELEANVTWIQKPDGTVWAEPASPPN
jgi:hypothetical protein